MQIFYGEEQLITGSYGELFIKCGQPTCRCHQERGHFATRLSRWVDGKLKSQIVKVADRDWVKKASDHYKAHKLTIRNVQKLNVTELKLLKLLLELKTTKYD